MTGLSQADGDEAFELLVRAYEDAGPEQGQAMLARICLLLVQRVASVAILREVIEQARQAGPTYQQGVPRA
jgi:Protein of unknown function (DUF2783)